MDDFLDGLSALVHESVKRLKLGQTGSIQCSAQYPELEIRQYAMAYAMHKGKWFELKYDKAANVVNATRVTPPSWDKQTEIDEEEEL